MHCKISANSGFSKYLRTKIAIGFALICFEILINFIVFLCYWYSFRSHRAPYDLLNFQVLGAFWYLSSIERETTCWRKACNSNKSEECITSLFRCDEKKIFDSLLNVSCPIKTPNTTLFDFGIYHDALDSGIVESMDFPQKLFYCFWWGLQNLRYEYNKLKMVLFNNMKHTINILKAFVYVLV